MAAACRGWLYAFTLVAAIVVAVADADEDAAQRDAGKEIGEYTKQAGSEAVPSYLAVHRKLVTSGWTACKVSCDSDAECSGFKFTAASGDHLPLCEMLSGSTSSELGDAQKSLARDESDEQVNEASEALQHSEDKRKKAEQRAQAAERKLAKVEKKQNAKDSKLANLESKEATSKKAAINAQAEVKKDKVEVKELKTKRETEFDRKGQEKAAKKGKKDKTAELNMMKEQGKKEQKLEQEVDKDVRKLKLQKVLDANKMKMLKLQMQLMKQEMQKKRMDDVSRLDAEIAKDRKQLKNTQRVGKAFSAYEGKNKAQIIGNRKTADKVMGSIAGTIMVKAKTYKKMQALEKNDVKGQALMQDELLRLQKSDAKHKKDIKKLKTKDHEAEDRLKKMMKKHKRDMEAQRIKLRRELEKAQQQAAAAEAGHRGTLFKLHRSLSKRREGLESDIVSLRTRLKLEKAGRKKLIEEYTQLNMEEQHLRAQVGIINKVENIAKGMRQQYDRDIAAVAKSKHSIFFRNAKRKTLVGKFFLDVRALQKYLQRQIGIGNEKDKAKVIRYMEDINKRHAVVMDDIAKQSATEAHKLIDKQLAQDREALAGMEDPKAMVSSLEALKVKHAALKAEVEQLKKAKPTSRSVVSGIYKNVAQSINADTVKRLDKRLDAQLHTAKKSTVASKTRADKSLAKAAARIYAHQIAHARDPRYMKMKRKMYYRFSQDKKMSNGEKEKQLESLISEVTPPKKLVRAPAKSDRRASISSVTPDTNKPGTKSGSMRPKTEAEKAMARIKSQPKSVNKIMAEPVKPTKTPPTKNVIKKAEKIDVATTMKSKKIQAAIQSGNTGTAMKQFMKKAEAGPSAKTSTKTVQAAKATRAPASTSKAKKAKDKKKEGKTKQKSALQPEEYAELGSDDHDVIELGV